MVTYVFLAFLILMVAALALEEKIHAKKSLITGLAALVCLIAGAIAQILPENHVTIHFGHGPGHGTGDVHMPLYIPGIEWEVIAIILGSGLFIDVISKSGIFTWMAVVLTKISKGDPRRLLYYYAGLTVLFSAVLNNVAAMMIVGSLTMVSLKKLERNDLLLGFLLTEGLLTNVGGLLTLISSVPNIILGSMAGIGYAKFFLISAPFTLAATVLTLVMAAKVFKIPALRTDEEREQAAELVASFDEKDSIESPAFFKISWFLLGAFILTIATTSVIPRLSHLGMGYVAVGFALIALIKYKSSVDKQYAAIDWDLLAFFTFLFVVIDTMKHSGVLQLIGSGIGALLELPDALGGTPLLWSSAIASSVTDNVPLAAVLGNILRDLGDAAPPHQWWATIFGCNLGGNFTPIGSASTVVAVAIIHKAKLKLTFGQFVAKASPFAIAQLLLGTLYVYILQLFI